MTFTASHLAGLLYGQVLAIMPEKLPSLCDVLESKTGVAIDALWRQAADEKIQWLPAKARQTMRGPAKDRRAGAEAPALYAVSGTTAIIPLHGTLVNRGAWLNSYSGLTSFEGFRYQVRSAMADPAITSVVLDIDSGGGSAAGMIEAAQVVRELAAVKRVVAVIDGVGASAAYGIASAANRITVVPSAVVGSIGVVLLHTDHSGRLEKAGIRPTLIFAGAKKIDGNSFQALPKTVRADLQTEVDKFFKMFVTCVSAGRTNLTPAAISDTEAATFIGQDAVAIGLADSVGSLEGALAELAALKAPAPRADAAGLSFTQASATPLAKATPDPSRIAAFLVLPEAVGRQDFARAMAGDASVSIEIAKSALKTLPTTAVRAASAAPAPKPPPPPAETVAESWNSVIADLNARAKRL